MTCARAFLFSRTDGWGQLEWAVPFLLCYTCSGWQWAVRAGRIAVLSARGGGSMRDSFVLLVCVGLQFNTNSCISISLRPRRRVHGAFDIGVSVVKRAADDTFAPNLHTSRFSAAIAVSGTFSREQGRNFAWSIQKDRCLVDHTVVKSYSYKSILYELK